MGRYVERRAAALWDQLVRDLHRFPQCTAAESGGAVYVYGPSAIQDHHGVEKGGGGGVKHVRVVCHDVSGEGGAGRWFSRRSVPR